MSRFEYNLPMKAAMVQLNLFWYGSTASINCKGWYPSRNILYRKQSIHDSRFFHKSSLIFGHQNPWCQISLNIVSIPKCPNRCTSKINFCWNSKFGILFPLLMASNSRLFSLIACNSGLHFWSSAVHYYLIFFSLKLAT